MFRWVAHLTARVTSLLACLASKLVAETDTTCYNPVLLRTSTFAEKTSAVCHHLHQGFKVNAFFKRAFQSEILKGMKSTIWLGSTWYHLAVPQSLQCPGPACMMPHINSLLCSFISYTRTFTLKSMQRGGKSLVTRKRRAKHLGSACSSLNACRYSASL